MILNGYEIENENEYLIRKKICEDAISYIGVGFLHASRNYLKLELTEENKKKFKVDCAGLIVDVAKMNNIGNNNEEDIDMKIYSKRPDGHSLVNHIHKFCNFKTKNEMLPGDVLLMQFDDLPTHLAYFLGKVENNNSDYICHAYMPSRKVIYHTLDEKWLKFVCGVFEFKEFKGE